MLVFFFYICLLRAVESDFHVDHNMNDGSVLSLCGDGMFSVAFLHHCVGPQPKNMHI